MSSWSPTLEGFRAMFRRPGISVAEITWRWSFGAAACFLLGFGLVQYLETLPVSSGDLLLLRTRHPVLVSHALSHILEGSALRFVLAAIVLFSALMILWIVMSAMGRAVTLQPLVDYIRQRSKRALTESVSEVSSEITENLHIGSLMGLNFLRASLALTAALAVLAVLKIAALISPTTHPHPGLAFFLGTLLLSLIWMLWSSISWFLSVASIFAVREATGTFSALTSAVDMCCDRFGPLMAVGTWFGLTHLVLFFVATSVISFPLGLAELLPMKLVLSAVLLLTLGYFALTDSLHIGRLAAYIAILEAPPQPERLPVSTVSAALETQPISAMVDQSELILSDIAESSQPSAFGPRPLANPTGGSSPELMDKPEPTS